MEKWLSEILGAFDRSDILYLLIAAIPICFAAHAGITKKLAGGLVGLINSAEEQYARWDKSGELKHKWVVERLRKMIPALFRPFFSEVRLARLVDGAFDGTMAFARLRQRAPVDRKPQDAEDPGAEDAGNGRAVENEPTSAPAGEKAMSDCAFHRMKHEDLPQFQVKYLGENEFRVLILPERGKTS